MKERNLQATAGKQKHSIVQILHQSKNELEKGVDNNQFLHSTYILKTPYNCYFAETILKRQLHIMDSFTKCLRGANSMGWSNTNINLGST